MRTHELEVKVWCTLCRNFTCLLPSNEPEFDEDDDIPFRYHSLGEVAL